MYLFGILSDRPYMTQTIIIPFLKFEIANYIYPSRAANLRVQRSGKISGQVGMMDGRDPTTGGDDGRTRPNGWWGAPATY